jgi:enoyl-CoA hydratase/carnithine racemase
MTDWADETYQDLSVRRVDEAVAVLTLDLPTRRNMMSDAMTASWGRAVAAVAADPGVRAVVVTGTPPAFCSGGDLSWIGAESHLGVEGLRERMARFYRAWMAVSELRVPTIAAVNGAAIGAGLALAMACDIRYMAEDAELSAPFTRLGMHPGMLTTWSLTRAGGLAVARDLLLTGRSVRGDEAVGLHLASLALPADQVLDAALDAARAIAAAAPLATRLTKQALAGDGPASYSAALEWEALAQAVTLQSEDLQEGLAARRERRSPRFTGR